MEEVNSSGYVDLTQAGVVVGDGENVAGASKIEKTDESLQRDGFKTGLKKIKNRKNEVLFAKVLFFQFVVSGFVLLTLFVLKNMFPAQFRMVSSQLRVVINEGPKFCDGFDSTLREVKNFVRREKTADVENANLSDKANTGAKVDNGTSDDVVSRNGKLEQQKAISRVEDDQNVKNSKKNVVSVDDKKKTV